jgi:hypothetical protein
VVTREVGQLWDECRANGKFLLASLARIGDGNQKVAGREGLSAGRRDLEPPRSRRLDEDLRFLRCLERAQKWQQEEPWVMPGDTLHRV